MNLLEQAFRELYPDKREHRAFLIKYNGKFKGYNGNIRKTSTHVIAGLSKHWRGVSNEIKKGILQELLVRLYKERKHTIHMDLYNNFIKQLPTIAPKTHSHPTLKDSFDRVNNAMFAGMMDTPNLRLSNGVNLLGTYEYSTDTVTISEILLTDEELLDYVMYHELLHKKHQFSANAGRVRHHSKAFREDERKFPNAERLEEDLQRLVRRRKLSFW